jgi:hypothetical protein
MILILRGGGFDESGVEPVRSIIDENVRQIIPPVLVSSFHSL